VKSGAVHELSTAEAAQLRPKELFALSPSGRAEFRIQRELKNYNAGNRHGHWSHKHASMKLWQTALCNAVVLALGMKGAQTLLAPESDLMGARGVRVQVRRRIEIIRWVPSKRHFVKDTFENLPQTAKELRDAIKKTGLIYDDSAKWTDTTITQAVSGDGCYWTWIAIDAPEVK
jgi:hypothetical protein